MSFVARANEYWICSRCHQFGQDGRQLCPACSGSILRGSAESVLAILRQPAPTQFTASRQSNVARQQDMHVTQEVGNTQPSYSTQVGYGTAFSHAAQPFPALQNIQTPVLLPASSQTRVPSGSLPIPSTLSLGGQSSNVNFSQAQAAPFSSFLNSQSSTSTPALPPAHFVAVDQGSYMTPRQIRQAQKYQQQQLVSQATPAVPTPAPQPQQYRRFSKPVLEQYAVPVQNPRQPQQMYSKPVLKQYGVPVEQPRSSQPTSSKSDLRNRRRGSRQARQSQRLQPPSMAQQGFQQPQQRQQMYSKPVLERYGVPVQQPQQPQQPQNAGLAYARQPLLPTFLQSPQPQQRQEIRSKPVLERYVVPVQQPQQPQQPQNAGLAYARQPLLPTFLQDPQPRRSLPPLRLPILQQAQQPQQSHVQPMTQHGLQ